MLKYYFPRSNYSAFRLCYSADEEEVNILSQAFSCLIVIDRLGIEACLQEDKHTLHLLSENELYDIRERGFLVIPVLSNKKGYLLYLINIQYRSKRDRSTMLHHAAMQRHRNTELYTIPPLPGPLYPESTKLIVHGDAHEPPCSSCPRQLNNLVGECAFGDAICQSYLNVNTDKVRKRND